MLPLTRMLHSVVDVPCVAYWWRCHVANCNFRFFFEFIFGNEFSAENRKVVLRGEERFLNKVLEECAKML